MNERLIQRALINRFWSSSLLLMPNYTPPKWWECDMFRVTRSLYWYEYEIKLTKGDFLSDQKKVERQWSFGNGYVDGANKHGLLKDRDGRCPKGFSFVMPSEVAEAVDVPPWAGLVIARPPRHGRLPRLNIVKSPPLRADAQPFDAEIVEKVHRCGYYRYIGKLDRQ